MKTLMTKSWAVCRQRITDPSLQGLWRMARDEARRAQICFVQIMREFNGDPVGIEFRHNSNADRWAFVVEDASEGGYRVQFFDSRGLTAHSHYGSLIEAVDAMVEYGYWQQDAGALDKAAQTPSWAEGMAWLERIQQMSMESACA